MLSNTAVPKYYWLFSGNSENELCHHGIKGQKWGVRRFQNPDGTLTSAGKKRVSEFYEKINSESSVKRALKFNEKINSESYKKKVADPFVKSFDKRIKKISGISMDDFIDKYGIDFSDDYKRYHARRYAQEAVEVNSQELNRFNRQMNYFTQQSIDQMRTMQTYHFM